MELWLLHEVHRLVVGSNPPWPTTVHRAGAPTGASPAPQRREHALSIDQGHGACGKCAQELAVHRYQMRSQVDCEGDEFAVISRAAAVAGKLEDRDYDRAELAMALAGLPSVAEPA